MTGETNKKVRKTKGGPRSAAGKRPLEVHIDEALIDDAKVAALRKKTRVSTVVEKLLRGWLAGDFKIAD